VCVKFDRTIVFVKCLGFDIDGYNSLQPQTMTMMATTVTAINMFSEDGMTLISP